MLFLLSMSASAQEAGVELLAKPFLRYSKTTLTMAPARTSLDAEDITANAQVVTLQPRAAPALGIAVTVNKLFTVSYSRTRDQWQNKSDEGRTKQTVYEAHTTFDTLQFDAHLSRARGLFQDRHPRTDLKPFQDRLFRGSNNAEALAEMESSVLAVAVQWTLQPEEIDAGAAFQQARRVERSGWSPVVGSFVHNVSLSNEEAVVPADLAPYFSRYAETRNLFLKAFGLSAGAAGVWVVGEWYLAGQALAGVGIASMATAPTAGGMSRRFATSLDMRGSGGYQFARGVVGMTGYKMIVSGRLAAGGVSSSTSLVEAFWRLQI